MHRIRVRDVSDAIMSEITEGESRYHQIVCGAQGRDAGEVAAEILALLQELGSAIGRHSAALRRLRELIAEYGHD